MLFEDVQDQSAAVLRPTPPDLRQCAHILQRGRPPYEGLNLDASENGFQTDQDTNPTSLYSDLHNLRPYIPPIHHASFRERTFEVCFPDQTLLTAVNVLPSCRCLTEDDAVMSFLFLLSCVHNEGSRSD
jgi:hypothetical protein